MKDISTTNTLEVEHCIFLFGYCLDDHVCIYPVRHYFLLQQYQLILLQVYLLTVLLGSRQHFPQKHVPLVVLLPISFEPRLHVPSPIPIVFDHHLPIDDIVSFVLHLSSYQSHHHSISLHSQDVLSFQVIYFLTFFSVHVAVSHYSLCSCYYMNCCYYDHRIDYDE